jgi:hypothetical protein
VIEEGYIREDILPIYKQMLADPQAYLDHYLGGVVLLEIGNAYFIMDGHKRLALARYFYEMLQMPTFLNDVKLFRCDPDWLESGFSEGSYLCFL